MLVFRPNLVVVKRSSEIKHVDLNLGGVPEEF